MKTKKALLPILASALLLTMGLAACNKPAEGSKGGASTPAETSSGTEEKIVVTAAGDKKEIQVGETLQLTASVDGVEWSTKNTDIVSVDSKGLVTALATGSARITAKKDGYANGSITITIAKAPDRQAKYSLRLEEAEHYDPDDFWGMSWGGTVMGPGDSPVEDNSGATDDGTSLGWLQAGCKETMRFTSDKAVKLEMGVTMAYNAEMSLSGVLAVKFNDKEISMNGKTVPAPETEGSYYEFSTVSFGQVDLVAGQNVLEIEMLAQGPNMDKVVFFTDETLQIKAVPAAVKEKIEFVQDALTVEVDSTVQIQVKNNLAGLTYTSSDATIASVSSTGVVTGVKKGKATITVSKEGYKDGKVEVTVKDKAVAGQIILEAEEGELGGAAQIETNNAEASGTGHVGYLSEGASVTLKTTLDAAGSYAVSFVAASTNADWSTYPNVTAVDQPLDGNTTLKINGTAVSLTGKTVPGGTFGTWAEISVGNVNLKQGENTFVFEFSAQGPNIDCVKLVKNA